MVPCAEGTSEGVPKSHFPASRPLKWGESSRVCWCGIRMHPASIMFRVHPSASLNC
jgi:hypothetical protein